MDGLDVDRMLREVRQVWTHLKTSSRFTTQLLDELRDRLKSLHTFVPVYTPWVNGTVERLNRDILQVTRVLLLEYHLDTKSWELLLPLVQSNLNQTPVRLLGNRAPVELFTGLQTTTALDTMMLPPESNGRAKLVKIDMTKVDEEPEMLRESLEAMHEEVDDRKEKTRLYQMASKKGTLENLLPRTVTAWKP